MAEPDSIIVYGTNWCPDCHRTRRYLESQGIRYTWINIDQNKEAELFIEKVNKGQRIVPTVVFPDNSILAEPSKRQMEQKLIQLNLLNPKKQITKLLKR